jgi:hypothetical protein
MVLAPRGAAVPPDHGVLCVALVQEDDPVRIDPLRLGGPPPGVTAAPRAPGGRRPVGLDPSHPGAFADRGNGGWLGSNPKGADPGRGDGRTEGARGRRPGGLDPSHPANCRAASAGGWLGSNPKGADPGRGDGRTEGARGRRPGGLDPSHPATSPRGREAGVQPGGCRPRRPHAPTCPTDGALAGPLPARHLRDGTRAGQGATAGRQTRPE